MGLGSNSHFVVLYVGIGFSPVVFPHLTFRLTSLISMYSMCISTSKIISCSSLNNDILWTVPNALLISSISRCVS